MLPPDEEHPPRPDVPILRHLTYDELHAWLLGVFGFPMGVGFAGGETELTMAFTITVFTYVLGVKAAPTRNGVPQALEAMINEAWYFMTAYVVWFAVGGASIWLLAP